MSLDTSPNRRLSDLKYGLSIFGKGKHKFSVWQIEEQGFGKVLSIE